MSDSRHTQMQTWIAGAGLVFLILAFFDFTRVSDFVSKGGAPTKAPATVAATKPSPSPAKARAPAPVEPLSGDRPEIGAKGVRASVALGVANAGVRQLDSTVTIKLRNGSKFPVRLVWLAAQDNASFDLGIGRLAVAHGYDRFAGLSNCVSDSPDQCPSSSSTELAPGETIEATMTLEVDILAADADRAMKAKRGIFTARLSVYPPAPASGIEKTISVEVSVAR